MVPALDAWSQLKTKYESHEAKRQLCKLYDLFLADERVIPSLPKVLPCGWPWLGVALPDCWAGD